MGLLSSTLEALIHVIFCDLVRKRPIAPSPLFTRSSLVGVAHRRESKQRACAKSKRRKYPLLVQHGLSASIADDVSPRKPFQSML